ncbi:MAG: 23S rRNA (guanosine(2251)-2'-O)-methyltransferase RlmB, partial [Acidobacteriota bacterium]|nr:23S rRNA (guanosine(2251)-2'-O)-methyltransferase RlmB [Acidobacteriota bacterium]
MIELVFGFHPVREALRRRPESVERVLLAARDGKRRQEIEGLCSRRGVRVGTSSPDELSRLVSGVHNGFVAEVSIGGEAAQESSATDQYLAVLLEDIQDPRNLGALLRVCEGAGVGRVLLRDRGSAPLSATVAKASAGASEHVSVERIPNSANAIRSLKEAGYWVYGADGAGESVWETDLSGKVVI